MKKRNLIVGIIFTIVLIAASIAMSVSIISGQNGKKIIHLEQTDVTVESTVTLNELYPGDSLRNTYEIRSVKSGELQITFEAGDEQSLLPFLDVTVSISGEEVYTGALKDVISEPFTGKTDALGEVIIVYTLPDDVGNEAQKTALDLIIDFRMK